MRFQVIDNKFIRTSFLHYKRYVFSLGFRNSLIPYYLSSFHIDPLKLIPKIFESVPNQ